MGCRSEDDLGRKPIVGGIRNAGKETELSDWGHVDTFPEEYVEGRWTEQGRGLR